MEYINHTLTFTIVTIVTSHHIHCLLGYVCMYVKMMFFFSFFWLLQESNTDLMIDSNIKQSTHSSLPLPLPFIIPSIIIISSSLLFSVVIVSLSNCVDCVSTSLPLYHACRVSWHTTSPLYSSSSTVCAPAMGFCMNE